MKVITDNKITAVVASSENSNFLVGNLLDEHPKRKWYASSISVTSATLTISIKGTCDALALVGIVADSATVTISNPNEANWETGTGWETDTAWESISADMNIDIDWVDNAGDESALWVDFDEFSSVANIVITLFAETGYVIGAGVLYVGQKELFRNPRYGVSKGLVDFSIIEELSNGSTYYKQRDIVRTISGSLFTEHDDLYSYLNIAQTYGKTALMWSFIDDADNTEWILYARYSVMPTATFTAPSHGETFFELQEVL